MTAIGPVMHRPPLETTLTPDPSGSTTATDEKQVASMFEELVLHQLLKAMRSTVPESDDGSDAFAMETAHDMLDETIAQATAGSLGFERIFAGTQGSIRPAMPPAAPTAMAPLAPRPTSGIAEPVGLSGVGLPRPGDQPVDGVLSSDFGFRVHPITNTRRFHEGIDFAAPAGTEIRAVAAGTVVFAGRQGGYGNTVELRHSDGTITRYGHASRIHVQSGDRVEVGEAIADVGSTGQSTGPHLHFEARRDGRAIDPHRFLERLRQSSHEGVGGREAARRTGLRSSPVADMHDPVARIVNHGSVEPPRQPHEGHVRVNDEA